MAQPRACGPLHARHSEARVRVGVRVGVRVRIKVRVRVRTIFERLGLGGITSYNFTHHCLYHAQCRGFAIRRNVKGYLPPQNGTPQK